MDGFYFTVDYPPLLIGKGFADMFIGKGLQTPLAGSSISAALKRQFASSVAKSMSTVPVSAVNSGPDSIVDSRLSMIDPETH